MHVAFIYKFFPSLGGVERVMTTLANHFILEDTRVTIYAMKAPAEVPFYPLDKCVKWKSMPNSGVIDSEENIAYLVEEMQRDKIDLILNHDTTTDSMQLCKRLKDKMNLPLITLHHGQIYLPSSSLRAIATHYSKWNLRNCAFPLYCLFDKWRRYLHHKCNIRICDKYVLLSETFRKQLETAHNKNKLEVIPNPLSFENHFEMNQYTQKGKMVIMVGRLSEQHKRFSLALQVWSKIEANPQLNDWTFCIVGEGPDRNYVESEIKRLKLKRICVVGQADSEPYYRRAKIYFMTSAFEGFPLVLIEAQQNGCVPIVMHSFESVYDIIEDNKNGFIIKNNDVETFYTKTSALMESEDVLFRMAEEAISTSKRYLPHNITKYWHELFNQIIRKN